MDTQDSPRQIRDVDSHRKTNTTRKKHTMTRTTNSRLHRIRVADPLPNSDKTLVIDHWAGEMGHHQTNSRVGVG